MAHLTNKEKIIEYLKDGDWHCFATPGFFMKDDRTRISELRRMGYTFEEKVCDGRCNVSHNAKLLMRRLVSTPDGSVRPKMPLRGPVTDFRAQDIKDINEAYQRSAKEQSIVLQTSNGSYAYYKPEPTACCVIYKASQGRMHAGGCETQKVNN